MRNIEKLGEFWRNFVLSWGEDTNGAVVACYPDLPVYSANHAADIKVNKEDAVDLIDRVTTYFSSRSFPYVCFRVSPLTCPKSFTSILEHQGFEKKEERSVMVYKGGQAEDNVNPEVEVKEISKTEIGVWVDIVLATFQWRSEWKSGAEKRFLKWIREGAKCYLAYFQGKPVGTCFLISLAKTGGIFTVGTLEQYRRRGIGTTLTIHAVMNSIHQGNHLHTLEAIRGGRTERLYRKIGFVADHTISYYVKELHTT